MDEETALPVAKETTMSKQQQKKARKQVNMIYCLNFTALPVVEKYVQTIEYLNTQGSVHKDFVYTIMHYLLCIMVTLKVVNLKVLLSSVGCCARFN